MSTLLIFRLIFFLTLLIFAFTVIRYVRLFRFTQPAFPVRNIPRRIWITLKVALGQSKILQRPFPGLLHVIVFWGFLIILGGTIEMVAEGLTGREKIFHGLGRPYDLLTAVTDILAPLIALAVVILWLRRNLFHISRFEGPEIIKKSHRDANLTLVLIFLLMITITGMNTFYIAGNAGTLYGVYPFSGKTLVPFLEGLPAGTLYFFYRVCWWTHLLTVFFFANYLPYSKHFHVYLSFPNVFLSRLDPVGKLPDMPAVTEEVKSMLGGQIQESPEPDTPPPGRFGILDVEDITRKNYIDSLTCTQCGRCTAVCPANLAGSLLSPRKVMMNTRQRMDEKVPALIKGKEREDGKTLLGKGYITEEEVWACTLCNACVRECPLNINQPELIVGMRRYLVLEQAAAPAEWNTVYANIENNGALWKVPSADRMKWAEELFVKDVNRETRRIEVPVMAELKARGRQPEYLLWTGSAGAFDSRYRKVIRAFVKILEYLGADYAVLGEEERSSGDFARRTGNEMMFLMQALENIDTLKKYGVKKVITCDPHVYNTFKNEYPALGAAFEVIHHTQFLEQHLDRLSGKANTAKMDGVKVTYHDPCYLGRINGEYEAPRKVLRAMGPELYEMSRNRAAALCCGGGGGQMFRESDHGDRDIFLQRTEEALATGAGVIVTACPYCMTMMEDGIKYKHREEDARTLDVAEMVAAALGI